MQESIIPGIVGFVQEQLAVSDSAASSQVLVRTLSEQVGIIDTATGGMPSFVVILESFNIQDNFANIAASLNLSLSEMLMLPDSIITNQLAQFNYVTSHTLSIGDAVILSLQSGKSAKPTESMNVTDVASIFIVKPPPPPPSGISTMPSLTIVDSPSLDLYSDLTLPTQATKANGTWNITALDEQGLQSILSGIGMPVYDINAEAASTNIDQMTIILPAFRVYTNVDGQTSDDAMFLTPTLSRLPARRKSKHGWCKESRSAWKRHDQFHSNAECR
ncbi:MAG: hypothetical protein E6K85_05810 [Thaumarchaeota archaeon]|nr:MAG: hypothetical protein E6K85_05810 [Nitrososphaerota archaeon]